MSKHSILVLAGDGIGPEVTNIGEKVLKSIATKFGHDFQFEYGDIGHAGILSSNDPLPLETLSKSKNCDAILFGAIGHPMYDNNPQATIRPEQGLLRLRKELDLFANLRPIQIFPELLDASPLKPEIIKGTDILFYRELTGGLYFGTPRERRDGGETAVDTCIYTRKEIKRIAIMAFEGAKLRRKKVTSVDKVNVLETSRLWRETVNMVSKDYPEVTLEHQIVDSMAMKLIHCPANYDIILTENLFGDFLTDEGSQITGSLGMLASASIGHGVGLFEPIHGSAPDIAGLNIANPMASVLSVAMLLRMGLGLHEEAKCVENAVKQTLSQGYRTSDIVDKNTKADQILGTTQIGEIIINNL
jgi:3-isopropylmalate dehydrogenase